MSEPRMPNRVRLVRPDLYRDPITGRLAPDARDLYLALTTLADDAGWMLWQPEAIAATILPYAQPSRRVGILGRRSAPLVAAGLLIIHECGCATLPRQARDHAIKGGNGTRAIVDYHALHAQYGLVRTSTDESVSVDGSSSGSFSDSGSAANGSGEPTKEAGVEPSKEERPGRTNGADGVLPAPPGLPSIEEAARHLAEIREALGKRPADLAP